MKSYLKTAVVTAAISILALSGCNNSAKTIKTETFTFDDSAKYADVSIKAELPVSKKGVDGAIRKGLIDIMDGQLAFIGSYEGERLFPAYDLNPDENAAVVDYYRRKAIDMLDSNAAEDYEARASYVLEDQDLTDEQKKDILADTPRWEYDFTLEKQYETARFVVFNSTDYVYLGGAHGGVIGQGSPTFDKKDGHRVEKFLRDDALAPMQSLLVAGLVEYFSDNDNSVNAGNVRDYLFLEDETVPFPGWTPHPTENGLCFVYQQYEIAAYAMGMPSFTIPYEAVKPYLTQEAADLLGLK
ncbi:MAG: DUF3298 domain-containing protein [Bacteroidales bacterium]|nr:DUF3298 domain-containing protein [Bacteroidales bacterium]